MKKKLTLLCMTMVLGSTVLYASADGYTSLKK